MTLFGVRLPMAASLVLWAILWEIVGQAGVTILIPPLSHVMVRLVEIVPTESFAEALALTARAFIMGTGIAVLVGVPLGMVMGRWQPADQLLLPWVNVFVSAPLSAL